MTFKYLIAGGGIAGLYSALILIEKYQVAPKDICIIEKSYRWGRRIHTLDHTGMKYECGAGRFNAKHTLLMELINRYKLEDKMIPLSNDSRNVLLLRDDILQLAPVSQNMKRLLDLKIAREDLRMKTLRQLATEVLGSEAAAILEQEFGYHDDFAIGNAYDTMVEIRRNYGQQYYVLSGGLEQIVERIVAELKKHGVQMELHKKLKGWKKTADGFHINICDINSKCQVYKSEKLILALDKSALEQIENLRCLDVFLNSVVPSALTRIYATFPQDKNGMMWFHGIPKTHTNQPIQTFIPVSEKMGFCMISYSDGDNARMWQELFLQGRDVLTVELMKQVRRLFPDRTIPEPTWVEKLHWAKGVHLWRPFVNSETVYRKIQSPFPRVYICGEAYSRLQGWIEGALETAEEVARLSQIEVRTKEYTREDVAKSNSLTIINGQVYDLAKSDWINNHPGGEIIKKAIGIDSTEMYRYINHPEYASQILETLWVGSLKE